METDRRAEIKEIVSSKYLRNNLGWNGSLPNFVKRREGEGLKILDTNKNVLC